MPSPAAAPAAVVWAAVAVAIGSVMAVLEPNLLEEGAHLHVAERLAQGERLYRDVLFFTPPLPFELLALLFRAFGPELLAARAVVVALQGAATAAVFTLALRARAGAIAHAAAAVFATAPVLCFPMLSVYFYTTLAFYAMPLAGYAALRAIDSQRWAIATGVGLAGIALCKQTLGLALAAPLTAAVVALAPPGSRAARGGGVVLGGAAVAGGVLGIYLAIGDLGALVHAVVVMPLSLSGSFNLPFPNLWPFGRFDDEVARSAYLYVPNLYFMLRNTADLLAPRWLCGLTQILFVLPFAAILATPLARLRGPLPPALVVHAVVVLALTSNLYPRPDWGHLLFVLPVSLVHVLLLWPLRPGGPPALRPGAPSRPAVTARRVVGALLAGLALAAGTAATWRLVACSIAPSFGPRVALRPVRPAFRASNLPRVIEYLRERVEPGEPIFVARQEPLLYFATETRNPTPYVGVLAGHTEEQERRILDALEEVRFVVMSEIDQPGYHWYADELPNVEAYLERHFHVPADLHPEPGDWVMVYARREDRGETLADLYRAHLTQERTRTWTRDADGVEQSFEVEPMKIATQQLRRPLAVVLDARGGGVDFALEPLPEDAVFQASIGLRFLRTPVGHLLHPVGTFMSVAIRTEGAFEEVYRGRISTSPAAGLRWRDVEVDLGAYAGRDAVLRLEVLPMRSEQRGTIAWWGSPRLARRPQPPAPPENPVGESGDGAPGGAGTGLFRSP